MQNINSCIKYKMYYKSWIKYFVIVIVIVIVIQDEQFHTSLYNKLTVLTSM